MRLRDRWIIPVFVTRTENEQGQRQTGSARQGAMTSINGRVALACEPNAIPSAERSAHFERLARLFSELVLERRLFAAGYEYRFDRAVFETVTDFVKNESRCCPFLTFTIELAGSASSFWLRITGPEGTRDFLDAELPTLRR